MELWDHVSEAVKKVNSIKTVVTGLDAKIDAKVFGLDSKLDAILISLSEATNSGPSNAEREAKLDQLIFLSLKLTVEEV